MGDEIVLGSCCFTAAAVQTYAHTIGGAQESSDDGDRRAVHDWHIVAMWTRLMVDYYHAEADWLAGHLQPVPLLGPAAGTRNLAWHAPVYAGDRITFNSWVEHKVNAGTSKDWGMLVVGAEGINQRGRTVVSFYPQLLLQRRPE